MSTDEARPVIGPRRPFSNRERELSLFRHLIVQGKDGSQIRPSIICFWGAHGIGKSRLLLKIQEQYHHSQPEFERWIRKPSVARLDLARASTLWEDGLLQRDELVRELWRQFALELELGGQLPSYGSPAEWADHFVSQVTAWAIQDVTPVVILDTIDDLLERDKDSFAWLEQNIIERLAMTNRVVFVFGSRRQLTTQWTRLHVKRRLLTAQLEQEYRSHLQTFDAAAISIQVSAGVTASQLLLRYTFGHPLYTEKMASRMEAQGLDLRTASADELNTAMQRSEFSILQDLVRSILSQHPQDMPKIVVLSVLRVVSLERVRALFERMALVQAGLGDDYFLNFIHQLTMANLIQRDPANKALRIMEPTLRCMFLRLFELQDRDALLRSHEQAAEFYSEQIRRSHELFSIYLPELIYHRLSLSKLADGDALDSLPQQLMQDLQQMETVPQPREWCKVVESLHSDVELRNLAQENVWNAIIAELDQNCTHGDTPKVNQVGGFVWRQM